MNARAFFVSGEGRPHPPWRILYFIVVCVACVVGATLILRPFFGPLHQITGIGGTGAAYTMTVATLLAHWITFETFDQRAWSFVGLDRAAARPRLLLAGALHGAVPIAAASLLLLGVGYMTVQDGQSGSWAWAATRVAIILLPAAFYEELLVRGYLFATLREWGGVKVAVVVTSAVFGVMHFGNPGSDYTPIVAVVVAGVYLAIILVALRSLYAAWLAHFAWNFVQAGALHVPVSGLPMPRPGYEVVESGPDWLTGGEWGPEGGAAAATAIVLVVALMYLKHRTKTTPLLP